MAFKLRPYQQEAVKKVIEHVKICLDPCVIDAATGCHAYGHDIMMSNGTKKQAQDIAVGDKVMGPDGNPRKVIRLVKGQDEMFRVTPTKGESFVVNGGHILSLYQTPRRAGQKPGYTEISVNEYIRSSSTFKRRSKLQRFGFDLPSKNLPIPPYILGLLLGDGCITGVGQMSFTSQDHVAITEIESYLLSIGASNRLYFDSREAVGVCFKDYHRLEEHLTELGLYGRNSGNKFIPSEYLTSSNEDALEMIAGLLDTDGSLCSHGTYDYISKSRELSEGLVYLCRRVGLAAYISECEKGCQNGFKGTYYRVCVSGDLSKVPCRVSHKKFIFNRKQKKRVDVTGFKVESIGFGDYYGFTVDGDHLYLDGDFVRHHNCGKSVIIAEIAKFFNEVSGKKTLVIGPNKEICQQNAEKYKSYGFPASFWSASIGKKEMRHQVVFGSPVSIKNELDKFGPQFGAVIIDEAHLLSPTVKEICSHMKEQNNLLRIVGLTATPYRLGSGYIYEYDENNNPVGDECTKNPFFKRLVYRITAKELIDQGFLTPPIADHEVASKYDTSGVQLNKRNQFDAKDIEQAFEGQGRLTAQIISDVVSHCQNKMCCMIFAATIQHAQEIMESLPKHNSYCVTGKTKRKDREKAIERAKTGEIKYLVSVGTLTTGVDITNVDVIAILRATESASLLQQIIGRGLRLHENKTTCLVLDYAENIERHGLEDDLFNPDIRVSGGGEGSAKVNALCKICGTVNEFSLRKGCDPDMIDEYGYALDLAGERIEMEGQPMPAHYGRRCYGGDVINGHYVRCSERWSMKVCPECEAENDIAARYCTGCRTELVDPNEKLKADYKRMKRDPRAISTDKLLGWYCQPWITQRGNNTLRVDYRSEYRSFTIWYSPDSSNVKAQGLWNNLSEVVFGKGHIAPTPEAFCDALKRGFGTMPETITVQKQGDFFRAFAHGLPEDDKPE